MADETLVEAADRMYPGLMAAARAEMPVRPRRVVPQAELDLKRARTALARIAEDVAAMRRLVDDDSGGDAA